MSQSLLQSSAGVLWHCYIVIITFVWASHFCSALTISWPFRHCFIVIMNFLWASHFCRAQRVSWLYRHFPMVIVDLPRPRAGANLKILFASKTFSCYSKTFYLDMGLQVLWVGRGCFSSHVAGRWHRGCCVGAQRALTLTLVGLRTIRKPPAKT